jgi:hypothetical protein
MESSTDRSSYAELEGGVFGRLLDFLVRLDTAHIHHTLSSARDESVMVGISIPGERWEVEFMADGSVDIERFQSVAGVEPSESLINQLFGLAG